MVAMCVMRQTRGMFDFLPKRGFCSHRGESGASGPNHGEYSTSTLTTGQMHTVGRAFTVTAIRAYALGRSTTDSTFSVPYQVWPRPAGPPVTGVMESHHQSFSRRAVAAANAVGRSFGDRGGQRAPGEPPATAPRPPPPPQRTQSESQSHHRRSASAPTAERGVVSCCMRSCQLSSLCSCAAMTVAARHVPA
jgi:hypothetical protein